MAASISADDRREKVYRVQSYLTQQGEVWPKEGKHILAQYDKDSVVVYQAYCPEIADYAVEHQRFGGDRFSYGRMSWIKPNFLWMMYRSGWATKKGQEKILAVWITRAGFEEILSHALTGRQEKEGKMDGRSQVRLQWDPDHDPHGISQQRRAIQLGLRDEILHKYGTEWIVQIKNITPFVQEQYQLVQRGRLEELVVAEERVFNVDDAETRDRINLDKWNNVK